jgi:RNA polymerase II-associated protein 2
VFCISGPKLEATQNKVAGSEQSRSKAVDSRNAGPGEDGMSVSSTSVETHMSSEVTAKRIDDIVFGENTKTQKKKTSKTQSKMLKEGDDDMLSSCVSDAIAKQLENVVLEEKKSSKKKKSSKASSKAQKSKPTTRPAASDGHEVNFTSTIIIGDASTNIDQGTIDQYNYMSSSMLGDNHPSSSQHVVEHSTDAHIGHLHEEFSRAVNIGKDETSDVKMRPALKSSFKVSGSKSGTQSVTWADDEGSVLEAVKALDSNSNGAKPFEEGIDSSLRRASAEACAAALTEAAEAISSGSTSEVEDAGEHIFHNIAMHWGT